MKTHWFVLLVLSVAFSSSAVSTELINHGPLTLKLMATAQALDSATTSKTNSSSKGTTVTVVSKSTASNSFVQASDFLALLENSFNTNLPSGAQIVLSRSGPFYQLSVADGTGTNVILNVSTNVFIGTVANEQPVHAGLQTTITKTGAAGESISANAAYSVTEIVVLGYDDTGLPTRDGTHTKFFMNFLLVRKSSENHVTQQFNDTVKLQGVGNGIIRDQNLILQGTASASISGVLAAP